MNWQPGRISRHRLIMLLLLIPLMAGCRHNNGDAASDSATQPATAPSFGAVLRPVPQVYSEVIAGQKLSADDHLLCNIDVMHVNAPAGAISGNAELWTIATSRTLSPEQQRLLDTNGVRIGLMELSAWPRFKAMVEAQPGVSSRTTNTRGGVRAEIDPQPSTGQTIFYYDKDGVLAGRSYDASENYWGMNFVPQTQERTSVRLSLCPVVRAERAHLEFTRGNNEQELKYVRPEAIYELGLTLDIPVGTVLVLAPTSQGLARRTSIGRAFLSNSDISGLHELVYIIYPRLYRFDSQNTAKAMDEAEGNPSSAQKQP